MSMPLLGACAGQMRARSSPHAISTTRPRACTTGATSSGAAWECSVGSRYVGTSLRKAANLRSRCGRPRQSGAARVAEADPIALTAGIDGGAAAVLALVLKPIFAIFTLLFIVRIVLTWYPQENSTKLPWSLAVAPTEPVLAPTRNVIKPIGGVDISPIVWLAMISFLNEILLGPQGILVLLQRQGSV